jgi:hypothetical protein
MQVKILCPKSGSDEPKGEIERGVRNCRQKGIVQWKCQKRQTWQEALEQRTREKPADNKQQEAQLYVAMMCTVCGVKLKKRPPG